MDRLRWYVILLLALVGLVLVGLAQQSGTAPVHRAGQRAVRPGVHHARQRAARPSMRFAVGYTGVDYVDPASYFTGCPEWTWLQDGCYRNTGLTSYHISPQQLFASDLTFMRSRNLGNFQRVWISLDQLIYWHRTTGYAGYNTRALANVDDMLRQAAARGIKVDLVLLSYAQGSGAINQFRPVALDGHHAAMRLNYLHAVRDFVAHVARKPTDVAAIAVMDLENEAYYQLEHYFNAPAHLGQWDYSEPGWPASAQCAQIGNGLCTGGGPGHGCLARHDTVDTTCVDVNIIEPWLKALYSTAKGAGPHFTFTVSDAAYLLTTSTAPHSSQAWWVSLYPVDVYDIHLYDDTPWAERRRWATGWRLPKPWFAGETGCSPGNIACTYNSTTASAVDRWWLAHMAGDGARAVLIEDRHTVWTYTNTGDGEVQALTPMGREIARTHG